MGDWDEKNLIHEPLQGMELAKQLQISLHVPSMPQESRELLIQEILAAFEKALKLANFKVGLVGEPSQMPSRVAIGGSKSPPFSESPRSEESDRDLRDLEPSASRKRKTISRWTKKIRVNPGMGVEGSLDDGYSWRKYGQKDILGAKYPRGYYRCTHRNVQGCMAIKQVQRSDEDPTVFEINYRGKHTCTMASDVVPDPSGPQEKEEPNLRTTGPEQQYDQQSLEQQSSDIILNLRAGLRVQTGNIGHDHAPHQSFASFHFPSISNKKTEEQVYPSPMIENNFAENFSYPSYVSPATSGTNFFVSLSGGNSFKGPSNVGSSGFEINNDMISAANSLTVGLEFPFYHDFPLDGQPFTFNNPRLS